MLIIFFWLGVLLMSTNVYAQSSENLQYHLQKTTGSIAVDGKLNEETWQHVQLLNKFYQKFPRDSIPAESKTEVRLTYDENFLYVGAICYLGPDEKFLANTLYRDFAVVQNDAFVFIIDPYFDQLNGFSFELTPFGSQGERLISNGGTDDDDSDYNWDNKWFSGVVRETGRWTIEMAIPFKTLRFAPDLDKWGINFIRRNRSANTFSSWSPIPVNMSIINLGYTGHLVWDEPVSGSGFRYSIIPSFTYNASIDHQATNHRWQHQADPSLNFKLNFGSSLNLDGAINPDFSQIEVDRQQLNIGRFELSFPERRQFFLENSDLFANFGNRNVRPFFSRRIGLAQDEQGFFDAVPILGGLRLSGKIGGHTRIGLMNVQTDKITIEQGDSAVQVNGTNYGVVALQQQIFERSSISGLFINSQRVDGFQFENKEFDRVGGAQFEWVSENNIWNGSAFYFNHSKAERNTPSYGFSLGRNTRHFGVFTSLTHIGEGFAPETGFVPRNNVNHLVFTPFYVFRPQNPKINNIDVFFDTNHTLSHDFRFLDANIFTGTFIGFSNTSSFLFALNNNYTLLLNPFDPSFSEATPLPEGSDYFYPSARIRYATDQRKLFSFVFQNEYGKFFNGNKFTTINTVNLRWQPFLQFSLDIEYNNIQLPEGFGHNEIILIRPQARISFRNNLFLTYITQFNSLQENIGTNLRLQWRFRPVSDLFLVYRDNYTDNFDLKSRGISFKLVYWI